MPLVLFFLLARGWVFFFICFLELCSVFRPLGRVHFFYTDKRNGTKEKPPDMLAHIKNHYRFPVMLG